MNKTFKKLLTLLGFEPNADETEYKKYSIVVQFSDNGEYCSIGEHCTISGNTYFLYKYECDDRDYCKYSEAYGIVHSPLEEFTINICDCLINARGLSDVFAKNNHDIAYAYASFVLYETNRVDKYTKAVLESGVYNERIFDITMYQWYMVHNCGLSGEDAESTIEGYIDCEIPHYYPYKPDWCIELLTFIC